MISGEFHVNQDAAINKLEKRPDGSADAEIINLITATLRSQMPQAGTIMLTGDLPAEELHSLQVSLQALESMKGTKILAAESILCCAATVSQVVEADAIILVADCSYSQYGAVRSQREKIQSLGKTVFGCILYA